jgi:hypothetical protein
MNGHSSTFVCMAFDLALGLDLLCCRKNTTSYTSTTVWLDFLTKRNNAKYDEVRKGKNDCFTPTHTGAYSY